MARKGNSKVFLWPAKCTAGLVGHFPVHFQFERAHAQVCLLELKCPASGRSFPGGLAPGSSQRTGNLFSRSNSQAELLAAVGCVN